MTTDSSHATKVAPAFSDAGRATPRGAETTRPATGTDTGTEADLSRPGAGSDAAPLPHHTPGPDEPRADGAPGDDPVDGPATGPAPTPASVSPASATDTSATDTSATRALASDADGAATTTATGTTDTDTEAGPAGERWREVLLAFVDDPRQAVERADGLVDEAVRALRERIDAEHQVLREAWHAHGEASTEDLRTAMRGYRDFFAKVRHYDREAHAGSPSV